MQFETWLLLLVTSTGIALTPGPNALLVLSHGALYGSKRTLFTIAGGLLGFAFAIALCLFGIATLINTSIHALTILKWVGAIYLVWIGIKLWRAPPVGASKSIEGGINVVSEFGLFRQGLFSALANPKALLLYSAFLPQFIDPERSMVWQFIIVTATYLFAEFVVEYMIANTAYNLRPWLKRVGRRFNQVCGGMCVTIGVLLPIRG